MEIVGKSQKERTAERKLRESIFDTSRWKNLEIDKKMALIERAFAVEVAEEVVMTKSLQNALTKIKDWLLGKYPKKKWLLLAGNIGVGKTKLATAICKAYNFVMYSPISLYHESPLWRLKSALQVVEALQNCYDTQDWAFIRGSGKLFIDDLGTEPEIQNIYGNKRNAIMEILMERYEKKLPTILTTNLTLKEQGKTSQFQDRYGMRVFDRLKEIALVIGMEGESLR